MKILRNPAMFFLYDIQLRNSISLASRVSDICNTDLSKLESECKQYFNISSLFHSVNLSVWSMGHAVPFHTKQLVEDLGVGLGINSMQGQESKHQQLLPLQNLP
jgi:hypothetical protein